MISYRYRKTACVSFLLIVVDSDAEILKVRSLGKVTVKLAWWSIMFASMSKMLFFSASQP